MTTIANHQPTFVLLSGFMATGKSSVGPELAKRLALPFVDLDAEIEQREGRTIQDIFTHDGEGRFREIEASTLRSLLASRDAGVFALGGGCVTNRALRHELLERGVLITLTARVDTIVARLAEGAGRPNARAGHVHERVQALLEAREGAYAECHAQIDTSDRSIDQVVDRAAHAAHTNRVAVPLAARTYAVDFVLDAPDAVESVLAALEPSSLIVVTDRQVHGARGHWLERALGNVRAPQHTLELDPGEAHKNLASVSLIWDFALEKKLDRDAVVFGFGGGVVTDMAGFAASTLLRGVRVVGCPTTLLSMVDASVGGKTGFDHAMGKNLIGSFYQPSHVIVDIGHTTTQSERERRAGLAEIAKIATTHDARFFEAIESRARELARGDLDALGWAARRAVELKTAVVRDDEHEGGVRALLNFGHTLGHAIEAHAGFGALLHGEAVALGMVLELEALAKRGDTEPSLPGRMRALLEALGFDLSTRWADHAAAFRFVASDKKMQAGGLKFPIVTELGRAHVGRIDAGELEALLKA